ncbi:MAG: adenylate/guanylate cyclase domain-containing protein [Actinomycetota bacterium]
MDISGFTMLSEKLAKLGRVGAEEMADAIDGCFTELLAVAYDEHGSLLKFGGDALLLLFAADPEGAHHTERAARAAAGMRQRLRSVGKLETAGGRVNLRMSVGVHAGVFDVFLLGGSHRELVVTGPAASEVVRMESAALAGEILLSPAAAAKVPPRWIGDEKAPGYLLRSAPAVEPSPQAWVLPEVADDVLLASVPRAVRETIVAGAGEPEHRQVAVAFVHFDGTDRLLERAGPEGLAEELDALVRRVQDAADEFAVSFLGSDVDANGGKLILAAGAPRAVGEDEERMLLALRRIVDGYEGIPIRIGVHRGGVFAGDIGPRYRRTYTVMGDTVNLAARLMSKAHQGEIFASAPVLELSGTRFETVELEPFTVKGKAKPVQAWSVGPPVRREADVDAASLPLMGRATEMETLRRILSDARDGTVQVVEVVGEPGIGKTRLVEEVLGEAHDLVMTGATGEAYTQMTPYIAWRDILREVSGVHWEDASDVVVARLRELIEDTDPTLLPWLPLIAVAADAEMDPSPEVKALAPEFVRTKLHEAVLGFLRATIRTPTAFVFEDAHLLDEASTDLLGAIAASERSDRPWLFLVLTRPGETEMAVAAAGATKRLELGALEGSDVVALAEAATEDAPLAAHLQDLVVERANGNPQLLLDLLVAAATGRGALPESVEAAATVRIDALAPRDRQLLRRLSVFGLAFHPRMLSEVLEDDEPEPDRATWERLAEFFEGEGDGYRRFRRAVVRDAAYAGLPFRVRRRLHRNIAERWEREVPDPEESSGLISLHFFLAADHPKAWRYACMAGRRAASIYANVEASRFYTRALEAGVKAEVPRGELRAVAESLGDVQERAGLYEEAGRAYRGARRLADDPVVDARLMLKQARIEDTTGKSSSALRGITRALRRLQDVVGDDARAARAQLEVWYGAIRLSQGRPGEAVRWCERAIDDAEATGEKDALAHALYLLDWANFDLGKPELAVHMEDVVGLYGELGDLSRQADAYNLLGNFAYWGGRWSDAVSLYERGREAQLQAGDMVGAAIGTVNIAEILMQQGRLEEADRLARESLRTFTASGYRLHTAFALGIVGQIASREGRHSDAGRAFTRALNMAQEGGDLHEEIGVLGRIAEDLVLRGEGHAALSVVDSTLARAESVGGAGDNAPLLYRVRGYALLQAGDSDGASRAFQESIDQARVRGSEHEVALSLLGQLALARSGGAEADRGTEEEVGAILERLGVSGELPSPAAPR